MVKFDVGAIMTYPVVYKATELLAAPNLLTGGTTGSIPPTTPTTEDETVLPLPIAIGLLDDFI